MYAILGTVIMIVALVGLIAVTAAMGVLGTDIAVRKNKLMTEKDNVI